MLKAIETRYKGYRFRSRLEARWAVFFDALGLQWEYEPEGFDLGEPGWYLPDFRITGTDTNGDEMEYWFEIKPEGKPLSSAEKAKIQAFAEQWKLPYTGAFLLCPGLPQWDRFYEEPKSGFLHSLWSFRARPWWVNPGNEAVDGVLGNYSLRQHYHLSEEGSTDWLRDFIRACEKARAARFEHGQCG